MKVSELIEWLQDFEDKDAVVTVLDCEPGAPYYEQGGVTSTVEFDPAQHAEYTDLRGNQFVSQDAPYYNGRYLLLGRNDA